MLLCIGYGGVVVVLSLERTPSFPFVVGALYLVAEQVGAAATRCNGRQRVATVADHCNGRQRVDVTRVNAV